MCMTLYLKIGFLWFLKHVNILLDAQISTDLGQEAFCALRQVLTAKLNCSCTRALLHHCFTMGMQNADTGAGFQALAELDGCLLGFGKQQFQVKQPK